MSYKLRMPHNGIVHRVVLKTGAIDLALPDGDVYGVKLACARLGNGLVVPLVVPLADLSVEAVVTCLDCVAEEDHEP